MVFAQMILAGYILSLAAGMVIFQSQGVTAVNRFWVKFGRAVLRRVLKMTRDFFHWAMKKV